MNWLVSADPSPKILVLPPGAVDLAEADAAIELWEHYSRKTLDDSQRLAVQVMMALRADAKWAASTTGREMSRQNGKGDEIEVVELWGLLQRGEAILHTLHDAVLLATQTQQRMLGVLESHPDLRRRILRKWQGTGQQMIEMRNGGIIWYRTRTGGGGRGLDYIDRLVVDEAQHATEEHIAAVSPALLANPNSQLNAMGTAGIAGVSRWWWSVRKRALSADPGAFGYVGHTAETVYLNDEGHVVQEPVDPSDRSQWPGANPAVLSGRGGGMEFLEEQFRRLGATFGREHLGVWDPPPVDDDALSWEFVPKSDWKARTSVDPDDFAPGWLVGASTLSVEVSQGQHPRTSVSVAGTHTNGKVGADLLGFLTPTPAATVTEQVIALATDPAKPVARVVIDGTSPAGAMIGDLEAAGITVVEPKLDGVKKATSSIRTLFREGGLIVRADPELTAAASTAKLRKAGESSVIDRWSLPDASPLIGLTLAVWGHQQPDSVSPPSFAWIIGGS